jgi:hypothetical protein
LASPDLNIGPHGPILPVPTSRALVRVAPVVPRPVVDPETPSLGRSGLDLQGILAEPDHLVVRADTPFVALDLGLEQARGAFVRNHPADALTLLDTVWEGAKKLETGWYLRGSSLALLGLPGEADKLARQALELLPKSLALRFMQSVSRLSLGDLVGARAALADATGAKSTDVLLQVHEALLVARQGDRAGAERLMREAIVRSPDHPAVAWGRTMLRGALREGARAFDEGTGGSVGWVRTPARSVPPDGMPYLDDLEQVSRESAGDVAAQALRHLGARIATLTPAMLVAESRLLAGSLSAGGTMGAAIPAARAHAARTVLAALIDALQPTVTATGLGWEARSVDGQWQRTPTPSASMEPVPDALQATVRALVTAIREGRVGDAETILRRSNGAVDASALTLLHALAAGERTKRGATTSIDDDGMPAETSVPGTNSGPVRGGEVNAQLAALRLGLALLPEGEALSGRERLPLTGVPESDATRGWAAAQAASASRRAVHAGPSAGTAAAVVAGVAMLALYNAHPVVGVIGLFATIGLVMRRANRRRAERTAWEETRD